MQRLTMSLDAEIASSFDRIVSEQGYRSRSEAVRDLIRQAVEARRLESGVGDQCVANLSYIYNHRTRALAQRLLDMQHDHHDIVVSTTHVILDHDASFETMILKGATLAVRRFADALRAERGVRFGAINVVSVEPNDRHDSDRAHSHHGHDHASPHPG